MKQAGGGWKGTRAHPHPSLSIPTLTSTSFHFNARISHIPLNQAFLDDKGSTNLQVDAAVRTKRKWSLELPRRLTSDLFRLTSCETCTYAIQVRYQRRLRWQKTQVLKRSCERKGGKSAKWPVLDPVMHRFARLGLRPLSSLPPPPPPLSLALLQRPDRASGICILAMAPPASPFVRRAVQIASYVPFSVVLLLFLFGYATLLDIHVRHTWGRHRAFFAALANIAVATALVGGAVCCFLIACFRDPGHPVRGDVEDGAAWGGQAQYEQRGEGSAREDTASRLQSRHAGEAADDLSHLALCISQERGVQAKQGVEQGLHQLRSQQAKLCIRSLDDV